MNYSDITWRRFDNPSHAGVLTDVAVRRGAAGGRLLGTWVQFDVRLDPGPVAVIAEVRFLAFACPHVIAAADWIAEAAVGCSAVPALPATVWALQARFDVPTPKLGRLLIIEDAWIAALSSPYGLERSPT